MSGIQFGGNTYNFYVSQQLSKDVGKEVSDAVKEYNNGVLFETELEDYDAFVLSATSDSEPHETATELQIGHLLAEAIEEDGLAENAVEQFLSSFQQGDAQSESTINIDLAGIEEAQQAEQDTAHESDNPFRHHQ